VDRTPQLAELENAMIVFRSISSRPFERNRVIATIDNSRRPAVNAKRTTGRQPMEFKEGTGVYTASGQHAGDIDRVVLDPRTRKITHLVVEKGRLFTEDRLIPLHTIATATQARVNLKPDVQIETLQPFEITHYVLLDEYTRQKVDTTFDRAMFWYGSRVGSLSPETAAPRTQQQVERQIPDESIALEAGSQVFGSDGRPLGQVERMTTTPAGSAAYFIVRARSMLRRNRKAIPSQWIQRLNETSITLVISSTMFDQLPNLTD
jgi:sporulation protein YlmC with PRC-barrel domain